MTSPTRLAAFLRGMNLGNRRITNDELRDHFEAAGLTGVATFLASGNLVFDAPEARGPAPSLDELAALEGRIESHLQDRLDYAVDTFLRPLPDLARILDTDGLATAKDEGFKPHVILLKRATDDHAADALAALETPDDSFRLLGREVIWFRRGGLSDAPISHADLERALDGRANTMRTVNTVRRMVKKFG